MTEYTIDDLSRFHDEFTLRSWIEPGEMMRYAFLNTPEFLPHAVIHRDGAIAPLVDRLARGAALSDKLKYEQHLHWLDPMPPLRQVALDRDHSVIQTSSLDGK